jgi:hypothetical protein
MKGLRKKMLVGSQRSLRSGCPLTWVKPKLDYKIEDTQSNH